LDTNERKDEALGMPHRTADMRLRREILFQLVQQAGRDICYQCGEKITSYDEFSIEHKEPWLNSDDPPGLFFDLDNISFSHRSCNIRAGSREEAPHGSFWRYSKLGCRCELCTKANREHAREVYRKRKAKKLALAAAESKEDKEL